MPNSWIHVSRGQAARQARVDVRELNEEHVSRQGFFGPVSMLYHQNPTRDPVRVIGDMSVGMAHLEDLPPPVEGSADDAATKVLFNDDLVLHIVRRKVAMRYLLRNIDADTLYFVHEGTGTIATEFGPLAYEPGDFVLLQKGISYRVMPDVPLVALVVESMSPIMLSEHKQVGRHSPVDPTVLGLPDPTPYDWARQAEWELRLKHGDTYTAAIYDALPFDLIGWKGDLFPFKLNIRDIRPITSERFHLAPSAWAVFESASFLGVAFLPMSAVLDPDAEELPSRHRNVDTEEAILIRSTADGPASLLKHYPQGVTHGLSGEARKKYDAQRQPGTQRLTDGISIDAFKRLKRTPAFLGAVENGGSGKARAQHGD